MIDDAGRYTAKAHESLSGAEVEFANGYYNNCANRCYYACFQAAIDSLMRNGLLRDSPKGILKHGFVQAEFVGQLINRRNICPAELRTTFGYLLAVREQGDYQSTDVTQTQAARALARASAFVSTVVGDES